MCCYMSRIQEEENWSVQKVQVRLPRSLPAGTEFPLSFTYTVKSFQPTPSGAEAHIAFQGITHWQMNYLGEDNGV